MEDSNEFCNKPSSFIKLEELPDWLNFRRVVAAGPCTLLGYVCSRKYLYTAQEAPILQNNNNNFPNYVSLKH